MTDELKIAMVETEADAINMSISIDKLEADEEIQVIIMGETFDVAPAYFHEPIGMFIKESFDRKSESHLVEYLKKKYESYNGVPVEYLNDELLLDDEKLIQNFLTMHYGRKRVQFVHFDVVADYIIHCTDRVA